MYFRCLLPVAVEMLFMSTASGSRVGFHIYCHFLVAVEVAVEVAVAFQSGSRKKSGSRKVNDPLKVEFTMSQLSSSRLYYGFTIKV